MIIAVIALVVLALLLGHRIGDLLPMGVFLGLAAFDVFAAPGIPGSPDSCLAHHGTCAGHTGALGWMVFGIPLGAAVLIKVLRGDKRGVSGTWGQG